MRELIDTGVFTPAAAVEAKLRRAHESAVAALDARFAELRDCSRAILAAKGAGHGAVGRSVTERELACVRACDM